MEIKETLQRHAIAIFTTILLLVIFFVTYFDKVQLYMLTPTPIYSDDSTVYEVHVATFDGANIENAQVSIEPDLQLLPIAFTDMYGIARIQIDSSLENQTASLRIEAVAYESYHTSIVLTGGKNRKKIQYSVQLKANDLIPTATLVSTPNPTQILLAAFQTIDQQFDKSLVSNIVYNVQDTMDLDDTITIDLLLNPVLSPNSLSTEIVESNNFVTSTAQPGQLFTAEGDQVKLITNQIEITDRMKAVLNSVNPDVFIIKELHDNPEQVISLKDTTKWRWNVTAKKEGKQTLQLTIYRLIEYGGQKYWREVETYNSRLEIKVSLAQQLSSWDWRWLLGFIIPGLVAFFWGWVKNKKESPEKEEDKGIKRKRK